MSMTYSKELIANARDKNAVTFRLEINGHYAKKGTIQMNGIIGPKTEKRLWKLINDVLAHCDKREQ